jgi:phenylacetate-CoA ligase
MYKAFHKLVLVPVSDYLTGWKLDRALRFLAESQYWTREQIEEFQLERLKLLAKFAYENSTFYHELFDKYEFDPYRVTDLSDLRKLPVLSKDEIRENMSKITTVENAMNKKEYSYTATSGSTGLQLKFPITKEAYGMINAAALRGWNWMGFELGDKYIKISLNKRKSKLKQIQDRINRSIVFASKYNADGVEEFVKLFNSYKPQFLRSYPDPLMFIAKHLDKNSIKLEGLKGINTTGNILFDEDREFIEKVFGVRIHDSYSCEGSPQLFQCGTGRTYHISEEYAITEILNDKNEEVNAGETGRLITTDLWNFAAPFIRYDTNDFVVKGHLCSCGRELGTVERIFGRNNDILKVNGSFFIAQNFTTFFKYFEQIVQFKVVQKEENHVEFHLVLDRPLQKEENVRILNHWKGEFGDNTEIQINEVSDIAPLKSGKNQFVYREPSISLY